MNVFDVLREKLEERKKSEIDLSNKFMDIDKRTSTAYANKALAIGDAIEIVNQVEQEYNNGWIPAEEPPKDDKYILLSFANFSVPVVGRYEEDNEGGAYYAGDEDVSLISQDMIVNAWQPLPEVYREEGILKKQTNADRIRSMTDEQLADAIIRLHIDDCVDMQFCQNSNRCQGILDSCENIPESMCRQCLMDWLQKEA